MRAYVAGTNADIGDLNWFAVIGPDLGFVTNDLFDPRVSRIKSLKRASAFTPEPKKISFLCVLRLLCALHFVSGLNIMICFCSSCVSCASW